MAYHLLIPPRLQNRTLKYRPTTLNIKETQ